MPPSPPNRHAHGRIVTAPGIIEALARFLRARAVYPAVNLRVVAATEDLLEGVRARQSGQAIEIRFQDDACRVDGELVVVDSPHLPWLVDTLRRLGLAGLDVDVSADREDLDRFAVELIRRGATQSRGAALDWSGEGRRVRPVQLFFGGRHLQVGAVQTEVELPRAERSGDARPILGGTPAPESGGSMDLLEQSPEIRRRLSRIQARLEGLYSAEENWTRFDLLGHALQVARKDAAFSLESATAILQQALDAFEQRLADGLSADENLETALNEVVIRIAARYFARAGSDSSSDTTDPSDVQAQHEADPAGVGDLEGALADFASLPTCSRAWIFEPDGAVQQHMVDVLVDTLALPQLSESPVAAARRLGVLVEAYPGCDLSPLGRLIRSETTGLAVPYRLGVLDALRRAGQVDVLATRNQLDPESIALVFPHAFESWFDALALHEPEGVSALARFLTAITPSTLETGLRQMMEARTLFARDRMARLCAIDDPRMTLALGRACTLVPDSMRLSMFRWLGALNLPITESAAIRVLPMDQIPNRHLIDLMRSWGGDRSVRAQLVVEAGSLIRRFVTASSGTADAVESRIRAIQTLRLFPGTETRSLLTELARGWSFAPSAKHRVRRAAGEILRELGSSPCA